MQVRFLRWGALWSMYGVRKYSFSSGSIPENSSVKNIEIISIESISQGNRGLRNVGNLIQIFTFQLLYKTIKDFPIVQLVAHQFLALVVMVRVHLGKPNMYPQLSRIEHWTFNPRVICSNPIGYTKYYISLVSMVSTIVSKTISLGSTPRGYAKLLNF